MLVSSFLVFWVQSVKLTSVTSNYNQINVGADGYRLSGDRLSHRIYNNFLWHYSEADKRFFSSTSINFQTPNLILFVSSCKLSSSVFTSSCPRAYPTWNSWICDQCIFQSAFTLWNQVPSREKRGLWRIWFGLRRKREGA